MRVAIIGSRTFSNYAQFCEALTDIPTPSVIVSGGAKGADSLAARYAKEYNITLEEYLPDWDNLGKRAGYMRNITIIENCDSVIAFWDGISKGTSHAIKYANKLNKPVTIYYAHS